jgi:hypothetical protein
MVGILVHGDNHFIARGPLPDRLLVTCPPLPSNIVAETDSVRFCRFAFI